MNPPSGARVTNGSGPDYRVSQYRTTLTVKAVTRGVSHYRTPQGRYRVSLAPGLYSVRLMMGQQVGRGPEPSRARVVVNRMRRVDFSIDTGIR